MNRTPIDPQLLTTEALNPRVAAQIAAILSRAAYRQPVMLSIESASAELAPFFDRSASGLREMWRGAGAYPKPDMWTGAGAGYRRQKFLRVPAAWVEDAMRSGPRALTRPVPRTVIVRGLANWPELMSVSTVAECLSAGKTSCRELIEIGLLGPVTLMDGKPYIRKGALADHLARCIKTAVDSWKVGG